MTYNRWCPGLVPEIYDYRCRSWSWNTSGARFINPHLNKLREGFVYTSPTHAEALIHADLGHTQAILGHARVTSISPYTHLSLEGVPWSNNTWKISATGASR